MAKPHNVLFYEETLLCSCWQNVTGDLHRNQTTETNTGYYWTLKKHHTSSFPESLRWYSF